MLDFVYKKVSGALLGGAKHSHPMADIKQANKLISELPPYDAVKALGEITFWIDSVTHAEEFKLDYRFKLLDLLDQAGNAPQHKLAKEHLATNRREKVRQDKLWAVVFEYWKILANGYVQCVEQFQSGAVGAAGVRKHLPVIVARGLRALTLQLKWALQRYGPVDDRIWGDLGRLYLIAETQGFATTVTEIYPVPDGQCTAQQEFLKAMVLTVSSTDSLTPLQQEIAERTIAHLSAMYTLHSKQEIRSNHFFDLSTRKQPARALAAMGSSDMTRFFGAGKALLALEQLANEIKAKKSVPAHISRDGTFEADIALSVMRHLALYWSDRPPARRSERRKIATGLMVVHSYRQALKKILPPEEDKSLDFQAQYASENWIIENINDGGFGAIIPPSKGDWISVGSLLGLQTETSESWGIGVVRRITCDQYQQRRVGIQVLSKTGIPVSLSPAGVVSSKKAVREDESAILLSSTPDHNGEIDLLLREGSFTSGQELEMTVRGKRYQMLSTALVERGDDFDWAKFKISSAGKEKA